MSYIQKKEEEIKSNNMEHLCGRATKKPVEINWFKWQGHSVTHVRELKAWIESLGENPKDVLDESRTEIRIKTLEGTSYALSDGNIVIRGVKGEYYPCNSLIFLKTYNLV